MPCVSVYKYESATSVYMRVFSYTTHSVAMKRVWRMLFM